MSRFRMGEWVMLTSQKGKKWYVKIEDAPFSTHLGTLNMTDVVGKQEGDFLETHKGAKMYLFRSTLEDYIFTMNRPTQVIYPKDLGAMVFYGDIQPGHLILESGIGSGSLSLALLRALGGQGRLVSVEKRPEFAVAARENITRFFGEHPANHSIVVGDIQDFGMTVRADRVFLDLPEPWHCIPTVSGLLTEGGILVSLSPNIGQLQAMYKDLKHNGFANIRNFELLKRDWLIDERRARPNDRMIAHTGFLTVARKTPVTIPGSMEE